MPLWAVVLYVRVVSNGLRGTRVVCGEAGMPSISTCISDSKAACRQCICHHIAPMASLCSRCALRLHRTAPIEARHSSRAFSQSTAKRKPRKAHVPPLPDDLPLNTHLQTASPPSSIPRTRNSTTPSSPSVPTTSSPPTSPSPNSASSTKPRTGSSSSITRKWPTSPAKKSRCNG